MLEYDKGRLRNFPHIYYVNLDNRKDRRREDKIGWIDS